MDITRDGVTYSVYLEDDGSLDTVFSINGHILRYDSEGIRNEDGPTNEAFEQALDDYLENRAYDEKIEKGG